MIFFFCFFEMYVFFFFLNILKHFFLFFILNSHNTISHSNGESRRKLRQK